MKLKFKLIILITLCSFLLAFPHGGKVNGANTINISPTIYSTRGGFFSTSSNIVNVGAISIINMTSNITQINPGDTVVVQMAVQNNGLVAATLTSVILRIYDEPFANMDISGHDPVGQELPNGGVFSGLNAPAPALGVINPGQIITYNFTVLATAAAATLYAAGPAVVVDGEVASSLANDHWWTAGATILPSYQYASRVTLNWDISGPPFVTSIAVSPNPVYNIPAIITVNFSEDMSSAVVPGITYRTGGATYNIVAASGTGWVDADTWVGAFTIPALLASGYEALATVSALSATDATGVALIPSYNVGFFEIDTLKPTASIGAASTANVAIVFPVTLSATDSLVTPTTIVLHVLLNSGAIDIAPVEFTASFNSGRDWLGQVTINTDAAVGSIASFNITGVYTDHAHNSNNVLLGVSTVNIGEALPIIYEVQFDTVVAYDGVLISDQPYISVFVHDYKNLPAPAIDALGLRVTVDGVAVVGLPALPVETLPGNNYRIYFTYPGSLGNGTHTFSFRVRDNDTPQYLSNIYIVDVNVSDDDLALDGNPVPFPNPFSPDGDGVNDTTFIVYELTRSAEIYMYIYDMNGDLVWRKTIASGDEGGHAGINKVEWDGRATFGREDVLPNGLYICHIVADLDGEKRSLGRTKIFILK